MRYSCIMQNSARILPRPFVIDADGFPVPNPHVMETAFPGDAIETALGSANTIIDPGVAKVPVGELTIRGVALC